MSNKWKIFWVVSLAFVVFFQACGINSWQELLISTDYERQIGREYDSLIRLDSKDCENRAGVMSSCNDKLLERDNMGTQDQKDFYDYYQARAKELLKFISDSEWEGLLPSSSLCGYNLTKQSCTRDNFFDFNIIESNTLNAFALPGGYVYFYTAILNNFSSESELMSVLGHEIGHVVKHHTRERLIKSIGASAIIDALLGSGLAGTLASLGASYQLTQNGQDNESESDEVAFIYTHKLGVSSKGLSVFFEQGLNIDPVSGDCLGQGSGFWDAVGQAFSSHPPSCERVNRNNERIRATGQDYPMDRCEGKTCKTYKELITAANF